MTDGREVVRAFCSILQRHLEGVDRMVAAIHVFPDGDAVGSALALCNALEGRVDSRTILVPGTLNRRYAFLEEVFGEGLEVYEIESEQEARSFCEKAAGALLFVLDSSGWSRLGVLEEALRNGSWRSTFCIDHHPGNRGFLQHNLVDSSSSSAAELVYRVLEELGLGMDYKVALPLYVAFMTETGSFHYSNTSSTVHRMVAGLIDQGVDPDHVYREIYERFSESRLSFLSGALARVERRLDGRVGWLPLDYEFFRRYNATIDDAVVTMAYVRGLEGVEVAVVLMEDEPGKTKVSLRAVGDVDVSRIASVVGGGGHKTASGALLSGDFEDVSRRLLDAIESYWTANGKKRGME